MKVVPRKKVPSISRDLNLIARNRTCCDGRNLMSRIEQMILWEILKTTDIDKCLIVTT